MRDVWLIDTGVPIGIDTADALLAWLIFVVVVTITIIACAQMSTPGDPEPPPPPPTPTLSEK